jgi:excisionase family DNA binding protein
MTGQQKSELSGVSGVRISKRLYTIEEAAFYLGRTAWSVRELIWKGHLPSVKVGRRVHLDYNDLNQFVDRYKTQESV